MNMKHILFIILIFINFTSLTQVANNDTNVRRNQYSFGISKDLFEMWPADNENKISYPYYQYTASYNRYFWGDDIIHGGMSIGLGLVKKTFHFDNVHHNTKTHITLHIPANVAILTGRQKNFLVSGLGLFYNGTQIAPSPAMGIDDTVPAPKYSINSVFTHFFIGYKGFVTKKWVVNIYLFSGRRDLFDFNIGEKTIVPAKPHFQIKIEYFAL